MTDENITTNADDETQIASSQDYADAFDKADWQGQPREPSAVYPSSDHSWFDNPYGATLRICWLTICKTKPELLETVQGMWDTPDPEKPEQPLIIDVRDRIHDLQGLLRNWLQLADDAEMRLLAASSKLEVMGTLDRMGG